MGKKLSLKLRGSRHIQGILQGFDPPLSSVAEEPCGDGNEWATE
ncbi:Small nuclear ribonucleoprotein G [Lemmus lemmus]